MQLATVPRLRKDVEALPLLAQATNPAANRVNTTLALLNRRMVKELHDCDASYKQWAKGEAHAGAGDPTTDWTRHVQVTMQGPRYLSLVVRDDSFCGGAHPDTGTMALVFDMATGAEVNWTKMTSGPGVAAYSDTSMDGSTLGALVYPPLLALYLKSADADCKDSLQADQSFQLWPDAKSGTLVVKAFDLPHAAAVCGNDVNVPLDEARKLGFSEALLAAIREAHFQSGEAVRPPRRAVSSEN